MNEYIDEGAVNSWGKGHPKTNKQTKKEKTKKRGEQIRGWRF